jgi:hypothetical protein
MRCMHDHNAALVPHNMKASIGHRQLVLYISHDSHPIYRPHVDVGKYKKAFLYFPTFTCICMWSIGSTLYTLSIHYWPVALSHKCIS